MDTDTPSIIIATHHSDEVTFTQLQLVGVTWFVIVQHTVPVQSKPVGWQLMMSIECSALMLCDAIHLINVGNGTFYTVAQF